MSTPSRPKILLIFTESRLKGVFVIDPEPRVDERGFFARTFCRHEFAARSLNSHLAQCSVSFNRLRGTLRGMHFQAAPHAEAKLVRCSHGALWDVAIDLRPESPTFLQWTAVELTALNRRMHYIPEGLAHGFQTLIDDTEVFYQISEFYRPAYARGLRWNDPAFAVPWPVEQKVISPRDAAYPDFSPVLGAGGGLLQSEQEHRNSSRGV